jgi:thiol-disulfide isomerase/thioredoxin
VRALDVVHHPLRQGLPQLQLQPDHRLLVPQLHQLRRRCLLTMAALVAAVVVLGLFCVLNAVFCFGIVRRLREHTELLDKLAGGGQSDLIVGAGASVGDFTASTVDSVAVSGTTLAGPTLVAFFAPGCGPCTEERPKFAALAATHPRDRVLVVVTGLDDEAAAPLVAELRDLAGVVREDDGGPVQQAFGVGGYPTFALVESGVVVASGTRVADLPVSVPA